MNKSGFLNLRLSQEEKDALQKERPYFGPDQVRDKSELRPGMKCILHWERAGRTAIIMVLSYPFLENDLLRIRVRYENKTYNGDGRYLCDSNVVPYPDGYGWHRWNWIRKI